MVSFCLPKLNWSLYQRHKEKHILYYLETPLTSDNIITGFLKSLRIPKYDVDNSVALNV